MGTGAESTMTNLVEKQKRLCRLIHKTGNQTESYMEIYKVKSLAVAEAACSRIMKRPKMRAYMDKLNKPLDDAAIADVNERKERLTTFIREDIEGRFGVNRTTSIMATQELNKMEKVYTEEREPGQVFQTFVFVLPDGTRVLPGKFKELGEGN